MRIPLAVFVTLTIATFTRADDWPQWLGAHRDGGSKEIVKPWKEPLKILWKQPVGEGHGGPVVVKGKVYLHFGTTGRFEENLATFDADTGKPLWKSTYPRRDAKFPFGNGPRGAPCVEGGKVYTFGITGVLSCFDDNSDKIIWQVDTAKIYKSPALTFGSSCSPIVVNDLVFVNVGAKGASIVAFDKNTGKEVWKKLNDGASYSSPISYQLAGTPGGAPTSPRVVFLTAKGLVCLSAKDGDLHWRYPFVDLLNESSCTPVLVHGKFLASSVTAGSVLVEEEAGKAAAKKVWSNSFNCYFSTPVLVKDALYMVTGELLAKTAILRRVDANTGKLSWNRPNVGKYHATLLRTGDDKLLLVEEPGNLVLFDPDPKEYRELSRTKICGNTWAHPALANGRLYIRDAQNLICVEMPK